MKEGFMNKRLLQNLRDWNEFILDLEQTRFHDTVFPKQELLVNVGLFIGVITHRDVAILWSSSRQRITLPSFMLGFDVHFGLYSPVYPGELLVSAEVSQFSPNAFLVMVRDHDFINSFLRR